MLDKKYNIPSKYKIWFSIPIAIIVISVVMFAIYSITKGGFSKGFNVGIDYTGGTVLNVKLGKAIETDEQYQQEKQKIVEVIEKHNITVGVKQVSGDGDNKEIVLKYTDADKGLNDQIVNEIKEMYPQISETFVTYNYIGSIKSGKLIAKSILSIVIAGIVILLYIVIRFEIWSGVTAIIALLHDILMIFAFTIIFNIQINSNYIAVIITIIAYSINNTIVVFDRVRENIALTPPNTSNTYTQLVNKSIFETVGRSINTTITTMLTIAVLAIISIPMNIEVIRDFSFLIIVGLIAGTFSSLFIAPTIYALARDRKLNKMKVYNK